MVELALHVGELDGVPVVAAVGEIDFATAPRLRDTLLKPVMDGQTRVVADLAGVEFLDSTGLGVLVAVLKRARSLGGDLALVVTSQRIRAVFEVTGLTEVFTLAVDPAAAVASLKASS